MEWRKYKKKMTDHTFQKGIVLKMKKSEYINSMTWDSTSSV